MLPNLTVIKAYVGIASVTSDVLLMNGMAFAFGALHLRTEWYRAVYK
jgi:hypothetical protein